MNRLRIRRISVSRLIAALLVIVALAGCSVLRRPDPPMDRTQDSRILEQVRAQLAAEPGLDASRLRVEVDGGIVLLYGSVDGIGGWNCAIRNAQMIDGVQSVVDYLVIERADGETPCRARRPFTMRE